MTGGTRGIGAAIAKRLKNDGYTAVVCDVVDEQIGKFKEETGIPGYKVDVADTAAVAAMVKQIESDHGRSTSSSTTPASPVMRAWSG